MKILAIFLVLASQTAWANKALDSNGFNTLIQAQTQTQKEVHSALNEEIQPVEVQAEMADLIEPKTEDKIFSEVIVLGTDIDRYVKPVNSDESERFIFSDEKTEIESAIVAEQKQFKQLGEELSQAQ